MKNAVSRDSKDESVVFYAAEETTGSDFLSVVFPINAKSTLYVGLQAYVRPQSQPQALDVSPASMRSAVTNTRLISVTTVRVLPGQSCALDAWAGSPPRTPRTRCEHDRVVSSDGLKFQDKLDVRWRSLREAFFVNGGGFELTGNIKNMILAAGQGQLSDHLKGNFFEGGKRSFDEVLSDAICLFQALLDEYLIVEDFEEVIARFSHLLSSNLSVRATF